jgi:hypothetical protein
MSKNVYNYHKREEMFFPVIESIKKIDLNDFKKNIDDKSNYKYLDYCSRNKYDRYEDINEDKDDNDFLNKLDIDNIDTSTLLEETKQIVNSWKLKKLYEEYPYENFDDEEYHKIDNEDDNIDEQKK